MTWHKTLKGKVATHQQVEEIMKNTSVDKPISVYQIISRVNKDPTPKEIAYILKRLKCKKRDGWWWK
jgi:hypothetical protein